MSPSRSVSRLTTLILFFLFSFVLNAADLSLRHEPQGDLEVRLDYALAKPGARLEGSHRWVYSSYLTFNEDVSSITDGQLKKIAMDAFQEMEAEVKQYKPDPPAENGKLAILPGVMTIMAFDKEIILASSQKGRSGFIDHYSDSPVKEALDLCRTLWRETIAPANGANAELDHKNQRKCGEISAFHQYYQIHNKKIGDLDPKSRVTSIYRSRGLHIIPPCGGNTANGKKVRQKHHMLPR